MSAYLARSDVQQSCRWGADGRHPDCTFDVTKVGMDNRNRKRLETAVAMACVVAVAVVMIAGFGDDSDGEYVIVGLIMASMWIYSRLSRRAGRRD
jgi:hypothetical protein